MQENELTQIDEQIEAEKEKVNNNLFAKKEVEEKKDHKDELINGMFEQAVVANVQNNEELKNKVLNTAQTYTETKMQTIAANVDTEHKKAVFENSASACECYGFTEKTTPIWAVKTMKVGYSVMLALWLIVGTFTYMPIIFMAKKITLLVKHIWIGALFAILIYLGVTVGIPLLTNLWR